MLIKLYQFRVVTLLTSTLWLAQCTTAGNSSASEIPATPPAKTIIKKQHKSPYIKPTSTYLNQAKQQDGPEKQKSLLMAAGKTIAEGHWQQGMAILAQTADLTAELADEKNLLLAQIELMRDKPQQALIKLRDIGTEKQLPPYLQVQFHELSAQAYNLTNKPAESINERIKLEPLLTEEYSQKNNRRKLWLTITHLTSSQLEVLAAESNRQSEFSGWIQLALISRKHANNSHSLLVALEQWQRQYPGHTANNILPNPLNSIANKLLGQTKQVALLLPLSGALQGPGTAILDGFMDAHKKDKRTEPLQIKSYDTNTGDITTLYQNAINEGADYVVGPLTKAQVAVIAELPHPVPTLLLNDADNKIQENSYLFGLSPANEAVQVAVKAHLKGYSRALIIAPDNAWGVDVSKAFIQQWQKKGGLIVDTLVYGNKDDLNKKMKDFLHVTQGQQREKKIKELLGYNIESVVNRRQDFDMIFLLAYPSKARQIKPLLNYYYAGDVPVFATASVYTGSANPLKDKDLDGLIFCDIPWVFAHQMGARNWPEQFNSYNRLYALGKDSYSLATQLNNLLLFPADEALNGEGILYLKSSQQIARVLEWGQFKQGLAHSLGEAA